MNRAEEEWRPVLGFEGLYEVSSYGQIRSLRSGRLMRLQIDRGGYASCLFSPGGGAKPVRIGIHRVVCIAWHGEPPLDHEVAHNNGVKTDNAPSNLRWASRSENILDLVSHGNHFNARKTECVHGHEFTEENTLITQRGERQQRQCRTCIYLSNKRAAGL